MTEFQSRVADVVRMVPYGKVMSYGQVAAYIGSPRAARQVGWSLRAMTGTEDIPWWRIINNAGLITIKGSLIYSKELQANLLRGEGIEVSKDLHLDIEANRHRLHPGDLQRFKLDPAYLRDVAERFD